MTKIVRDPVNVGTFNYFTYKNENVSWADARDKVYHMADILNWIAYGTGVNDTSTSKQRLNNFVLGTIVSMQYDKITKWANKEGYKSIGYKELIKFNTGNKDLFEFLKNSITPLLEKKKRGK